MLKSLLVFFSFFIALSSFSQEMPITGANINQCGGFLVDDGLSSSNYSNNLNETLTVCAVAPETIINLYWAVFSLGPGDVIEIYDGSSTSAPLIGSYSGAELQAVDVTSTNANGCLTVHFVSDGTGVGNFGAEISCGPPCERPIAVINTTEDVPLLICPGDDVTFDASASQFFNGAAMQSFTWVFDDGTTNTTSWPSVTHEFSEPGGYTVQLLITDNNDCNSANLPDHVVLVSTYPDFSLLSPNFSLCSGGTEYMGVNFAIPDSIYANDSLNTWISNPWNDLPDIDLGGALFIPDDQSQCFSDEVTFSNFDLGQTIQSIDDIDSFFINFEHSFIGDITITFICPNNQSVIVHEQGGGGTEAGEPIDIDSDLNPGVGYDYFWSPDATNGTWADNAGSTLVSGTYESVQPFSNLIGCPLNGTWTVEICDMWASDNGFIFDWGINFDPDLFGDLLSFTPVYGVGCDSTWWEGPGIITQDEGCDFIEIMLTETGSYDYTYYATNNFGCTFDTTITVDIFIAPSVNAGPDVVFSCDPVGLSATLDGDQMPYVFEWSPGTGLSSANIANPTLLTVSGPITYTLTGYPVGYPGCATSDDMNVSLDPNLPFPGIPTDIQICPTSPPFSMMDALQGNPSPGGVWLDDAGNAIDEEFDPASDISGVYYYSITYADCELSTPMYIAIGLPEITINADTTVCQTGGAVTSIQSTTDFNNTYTYNWSTGQTGWSVAHNNITTPETISVVATDAGGCESEPVYRIINVYDPLTVETFLDTIICPSGTIDLDVLLDQGGFGSYSYNWTFNGTAIGSTEELSHSPNVEGNYCVVLDDGCETPSTNDCFYLSFEEPMTLLIDADTTQGCIPLDVQLSFLNDPSTYLVNSIQWDFEAGTNQFVTETPASYTTPGVYDVTLYVNSARGCANSIELPNYITAFANPIAEFYAQPQPTDIENTLIQFNDLSAGNIIDYEWYFTYGSDFVVGSTEQNPAVLFPDDRGRTYDVQLTVTDNNGCSDIYLGNVLIGDIFQVYIPNTFTPNGDGINDVFFVDGADIDPNTFEITIFNRWGDVVYTSNDPSGVWLGGYYNNSEFFAPNGAYNYILKARSKSTTERKELKGVVYLLR
jgi:gliding motility-associated-like protein